MLKWETSTHTAVIFESTVDVSSVTFPFGENIMGNAGEGEIENAAGTDTDIVRVTEKVTVKVTEGATERVTENQQIILDNIAKEPRITSDKLAKIVGISLRKIKENMSKLKAKGFLERIGPDKGGYWKVKNSDSEMH
jgi:predicted HTH transcriptional regulator